VAPADSPDPVYKVGQCAYSLGTPAQPTAEEACGFACGKRVGRTAPSSHTNEVSWDSGSGLCHL
jgi:hypothetical protein